MKKTPLGYFLMKERYFLEQIIVPNAVFVVTTADPPEKLSWPTRRGGTALKYKADQSSLFNVLGFTLNNRNVATKNSGTKKMARTVAESMPPIVPVPIAF